MAILKREDFSNDIINPIELDTEIYDPNSSNKSQEDGNDYKIAPDYETGLKIHSGFYEVPTFSELSHDPQEAKLTYYREDLLLHTFHYLFHKLYVARKSDYSRSAELFYTSHGEFLRRIRIERKVLGLPALQSLEPEKFK